MFNASHFLMFCRGQFYICFGCQSPMDVLPFHSIERNLNLVFIRQTLGLKTKLLIKPKRFENKVYILYI